MNAVKEEGAYKLILWLIRIGLIIVIVFAVWNYIKHG